MKLAGWVCILSFVFACATLRAGSENAERSRALPQNPFSKGSIEIEVATGAFFSVDEGGPSHPTINYALESVRFGIMLTNPRGSGFLAGNAEFLLEGFGAEVFAGPGTGLGGATAILRYNFVHPHAVVVPYWQVGAGGACSNISDDGAQSLVGSGLEFNLQSGLGLRVLVNRRVSVLVEENYRHLSNAGLARRNHGLNSVGGTAGIAFSF